MTDVISEYRKWKQQAQDLRGKARQAMEARFKELLTEAVQISEEYRADFGVALKPPAGVTAFRYKAGVKRAGKAKPAPPAPPKSAAAPAKAEPAKADSKLGKLEKRLEAARKKLDAAKASGAPTRNLEDRVYEIEDEIRLAAAAS